MKGEKMQEVPEIQQDYRNAYDKQLTQEFVQSYVNNILFEHYKIADCKRSSHHLTQDLKVICHIKQMGSIG